MKHILMLATGGTIASKETGQGLAPAQLSGRAEPLLRGLLISCQGRPAGYLYLTFCYSAEVGGRCVFLEEIYLTPEFRGKGLGRDVMAWIGAEYPSALRFRLEVNPVNRGAARMYDRAGYQYLRYDQMVLDKII